MCVREEERERDRKRERERDRERERERLSEKKRGERGNFANRDTFMHMFLKLISFENAVLYIQIHAKMISLLLLLQLVLIISNRGK